MRGVTSILHRSVVPVLVLAGLVLLIAAGVLGLRTSDWIRSYEGRALPGTSVAGIQLDGLTEADGLTAVQELMDGQLDRQVAVVWDDERVAATPRELGATTDAEAVVRAAFAAAEQRGWLDRARMFWAGSSLGFERQTTFTVPEARLEGWVDGFAEAVRIEPVNAALDTRTGWVTIVEERGGRELVWDEAYERIDRALHGGGGVVELSTRPLEPEVTTADYEQVLLVRRADRRVYLYERGEVVGSWPVAVGADDSPTPTGTYVVGAMRSAPTWFNPAPNGWGSHMPARIGPGPNNPLGLRAINWMDGEHDTLIRFHGTADARSIGRAASQGCVRMTNPDVVELFDRVRPGATIVSL